MDSLLADSNERKLKALAENHFSLNLSPAEIRILHNSVRAGPAKASPGESPAERHVRGDFLRWLLSDPTVTSYFDKDGLQVVSANIEGDVDLDSTNILVDIRFDDCAFSAGVHFVRAALRSIVIMNSTVQGNVSFEYTTTRGDITLAPRFQALGWVTAYGAQISGDLQMKEAELLFAGTQESPFSLSLNEVEVKGFVDLTDLVSQGPVSILFARMGRLLADAMTLKSTLNMMGTSTRGDLGLKDARFELQKTSDRSFSQPDSAAIILDGITVGGSVVLSGATLHCQPISLSMQNATVAGSVYLTRNLHAYGKVDLSRTRVDQYLDVMESKLKGFDARGARIDSLLVIKSEITSLEAREAQLGEFGWAGIINAHDASLDLRQTHVKTFRDDKNSWPKPGNLKVVGLVYDDIELNVPMDRSAHAPPSNDEGNPDDRVAWLHLQSSLDLVAAQPWMQLAKYLSSRGNPVGAQRVLYDMKRIQARREGLIRSSESFVPDFLAENPLRVTYFIGGFWGLGSLLFWRARRLNEKAMAPKERVAYEEFATKGAAPANVPPFNPVVYALENILPVVKFGQDDAWGPNPSFVLPPGKTWKRWLPRFSYNWLAFARLLLIILGWALAIVLAGVIGELFKS
jgi:hypothetical protein